jgi:hypothetical protein
MLVEMHFEYMNWASFVELRNDLMLFIMRTVREHGATFAQQLTIAEKK